jgi:hypothetical protein
VNTLAAEALDDLLSELAQLDAVASEFRVLFQDTEDVALGGIGVHAEQEVRRGQVEQTQSMRLDHLGKTEDAAQFVSRRRNLDRQELIASLGRGNQVADRANTTDACHQRWHF